MDQTLQKLATDLGLSVMSVSRALQGRAGVSEETRDRVRAAADAAGYRPNLIARALLTGRTNNIGIIASDFADPRIARMFGAIEAALRRRGLQALPGAHGGDEIQAVSVADSLTAQRVDGLICLVASDAMPETVMAGVAGIPAVIVSLTHADAAADPGATVDRIVCETGTTVRASVRHLLSLGRKRLAFLAHGDEATEAPLIESWIAAHREAGITPDSSLLFLGVADAARSVENFAQRVSQIDGDAIVATTDILAAGALHGCRRAGRSVGRRFQDSVSILCLVDSPICAALDPAVTAFAAPFDEMASQSVELLADHIGSPETQPSKRITFNANFVNRATA